METAAKNKIKNLIDLSIVIPVHNESLVIPLLSDALSQIKPELPKKIELVIVNDGSTDNTKELLLNQDWPFPTTIISLSKNFGHQSALFSGMEHASGKTIVSMDADLQHPPALIPEMFKLYQQGYDVVLTNRFDPPGSISIFKKISSNIFYKIINYLSNTSVPENTSDFRLLSHRAKLALLQMPEHRKFLRGMVNWIGFKSIIIPYRAENRVAGKSKYSLQKMIRLALHGITSFSVVPLYISGIFGMLLFILASIYSIYVLYAHFIANVTVEGWTSLLLVVLILGGFLSMFLGLLGFYIAAIYDEVKQRPNYIVEEIRYFK